MPRYRHVLFDLDGTLADTSRDLAAAANHVREARGLPNLSIDAVCAFVGEGARRLVERVLPPAPSAEIDDALQTFLAYYARHLLDETTLYPGIETLLSVLGRAGVACSVLSNKPARFCHAVLDGLGVGSRFAAVVGGESLPTRKPHPGGVEYLQAVAGGDREDMLLVGDSRVDQETAVAARVDFCGVTWGFAARDLRSLPGVLLIDTAEQILALVEGAKGPVI